MDDHCGKVKAILMDEEILQKAVEEQVTQDQSGRLAVADGIHFHEILKLRLDYRSEKNKKIYNQCMNVYWV